MMRQAGTARKPASSSRNAWLGSVSGLASAISLAAAPSGPAQAQSIPVGPRISTAVAAQGSPVVEAGTVTITRGAVIDQLQVDTPTAIINWTTLDTAPLTTTTDYVNFLPEGTSLAYFGPGTDFAVLNRIFSAPDANGNYRGIAFNGSVTSQLSSDGGTGGTLWFHGPGGILVGPSATFNVGSLLLTTSAPDPAGLGTGAISLLGVSDAASSITIDNGASINALDAAGSYIAMVAPRIVQNGSVSADGSIAYVAAEEAVLTISNGLFDIKVSLGSDDANGVVHGDMATTSGPASTGAADPQAIYLVAVPKNDAITMLVGGAIGYQAASAANIVNGNIVLTTSANVDVAGAAPSIDKSVSPGPGGSITLDGAALGSSVEIYADDTINLVAGSTLLDSTFVASSLGVQDLVATAGKVINVTATAGASVGASGDVILRAGTPEAGGTINVSIDQAGFTDAIISGLLAGGDLVLDVSGGGLDDYATIRNNGGSGIGTDASAGTIVVNVAAGGDIAAGGDLVMDASAQGGRGEIRSGDATGGTISLTLSSGTIDLGGRLFADAFAEDAAIGKANLGATALEGGDSTAGNISIALAGGTLTTGGTAFLRAYANGSDGSVASIVQSNDAIGGHIDFDITGGSHSVDFLFMDASAAGGASFDADGEAFDGAAGRGSADIRISGAGSNLSVASDLRILASTNGFVAPPTSDAVVVAVEGSGVEQGLFVSGLIDIATGASNGSPIQLTQAGGVSISAANAMISFGDLQIDAAAGPDEGAKASAFGGRDFKGGDVSIIAAAGGSILGGSAAIDAGGLGAEGGNGSGGNVSVNANDGAISIFGVLSIDASGTGGSQSGFSFGPPVPTSGFGGSVALGVSGTNGSLDVSSISIANSGTGIGGGDGIAGSLELSLLGGNFQTQDLEISSDGIGGSVSGAGGIIILSPLGITTQAMTVPADSGGVGQGGTITVDLDGGTATVDNLTISANGIGGNGQAGSVDTGTSGGSGGDGIGGNATFNAISGTLDVAGTLSVEALGIGGDGGDGNGSAGGAGGDGFGGAASFTNDGTASLTATDIMVSAEGIGGAGGNSFATFDNMDNLVPDAGGGRGGDGVGGSAQFSDLAGQLDFSQLTVSANGSGGVGGTSTGQTIQDASAAGGDGGNGAGGTAQVVLGRDNPNFSVYSVTSLGTGGTGGNGGGPGVGGIGTGGSASLTIAGAALTFGGLLIDASGIGADAGFNDASGAADGSSGGDGAGGEASFVLDGAASSFITQGPIAVHAQASGGAGASGSASTDLAIDGGNGGDGGLALGGTARISAINGAVAQVDPFVISLSAQAQGGTGGDGGGNFFGGSGGDGGSGGNGTAGAVTILAESGAALDLLAGSGPFVLQSTGFGGSGGNGGDYDPFSGSGSAGNGGNGGNGTGGAPSLIVRGGAISATDIDLLAQGVGGTGGDGGRDGEVIVGLSGNGGDGLGGRPLVEIANAGPGIIDLGFTNISADGSAGSGAVNGVAVGGFATIRILSADPASMMSFGTLNVSALGDAFDVASGVFISNANQGPIAVNGDLTVDTSGNIGGTGSSAVGGLITLDALGNIAFGSMASLDGDFLAAAGGNIGFDDAAAAGALDFIAGGTITGGNATGDPIDLLAVGAITLDSATGIVNSIVSSSAQVTVTTDIDAAKQISGTSVMISDINDVNIAAIEATAGNIAIDAAGDVTLGQVLASGNLQASSGGALTFTGFTLIGNDIFLNSVGLLSVQDVILADGDISAIGQDDILLDTPGSLLSALGNTSISTTSNLVLDFGFIDGAVIDITARDVEISAANGAGIGSGFQTQLLTFNNTVDPMVIGGAGTTGAFSISNDELVAIGSAGSLVFNARALGASTADLVIEDLFAIVGDPDTETSGQIGPLGSLVFETAGSIQVEGNLVLFGANPATSIILDAAGLVRVNAQTGSIQIFDPNEGLGGTIFISAQDFMAVTDEAFADIQGLTLPQIDLRLSDSDGMDNTDGIIRADTLSIDTSASRVFIQNTALATDHDGRRGFEVNNLEISDSGGTIQPIVINGTVGGASGVSAIGETNVTSSFDFFSTINGCLIISPAVCLPSTYKPPIDNPRDPIEEEFDPSDDKDDKQKGDPGNIESMLIELMPEGEYWDDPLIDEPVTGAGNEDLWIDPDLCIGEDCEVEEPSE